MEKLPAPLVKSDKQVKVFKTKREVHEFFDKKKNMLGSLKPSTLNRYRNMMAVGNNFVLEKFGEGYHSFSDVWEYFQDKLTSGEATKSKHKDRL